MPDHARAPLLALLTFLAGLAALLHAWLLSQVILTPAGVDLNFFNALSLAGWLITGKVVKTKKGDPMKFLTFEDETGIVETVFFPKPYANAAAVGSLMMRSTSRPAIWPASFVACRCESL